MTQRKIHGPPLKPLAAREKGRLLVGVCRSLTLPKSSIFQILLLSVFGKLSDALLLLENEHVLPVRHDLEPNHAKQIRATDEHNEHPDEGDDVKLAIGVGERRGRGDSGEEEGGEPKQGQRCADRDGRVGGERERRRVESRKVRGDGAGSDLGASIASISLDQRRGRVRL